MSTSNLGLLDVYVDGSTPYKGNQIERVHTVLDTLTRLVAAPWGAGVLRQPNANSFLVSAGAGLTVNVAPGVSILPANTNFCPVRFTGTATTSALPDNRDALSPIYLHAVFKSGTVDAEGLVRDDSWELGLPDLQASDLDTLPNALLLASITTSATNILTVTDRRTFITTNLATTALFGLVKMNTAPTSAANPLAVGPNDVLVDVVGRAANTTLSDADMFGFWDSSASLYKKISRANLRLRLLYDLFNAKGNLLVGTGANTAAVLAAPANNQVLVGDTSTATGVKWAALQASDVGALPKGTMPLSVTGSRSDGTALNNLLTQLVAAGIITNNTTA